MKQISADFRNSLAAEIATLCRCWRLQRKDNTVLGLTDHDASVTFQNTKYLADSGMTPTALETGADLARDGMEMSGILGSPHLAADDLRNGLYDGCDVQLWLVDWQNPTHGLRLMQGTFGQVRCIGDKFTVVLEGQASNLQQAIGRTFQKKCDAILGDKRCSVNLTQNAYSTATILRQVGKLVLVVDKLSTYAAGWFVQGEIAFTTGKLAGARVAIRDDVIEATTRRLTLWQSLSNLPSVNDRVTLIAGCDKSFATCQTKFSNYRNFRGMPHMPAESLLVSNAAR
ncbi:MAG: DUF2163 domain-containing protein [Alphaproteobacteria bacterium]|nr:DUF2163 domain-containing protein [Alphaproteobacteria bacterium]